MLSKLTAESYYLEEQNKSRKFNLFEYFLTILVLIASTNPFFNQTPLQLNYLVPTVFLLVTFLARGYKIDMRVVYLVLIVLFLILLQGVFFGIDLIAMLLYVAAIVLPPYLLYRIIGVNLFKYLVHFIYITSILAMVLWGLQNIFPFFDSFLQGLKVFVFQFSFDLRPRSLLFYNVAEYSAEIQWLDLYRNNGLFHEPGAFAYWLIIAIGLNFIFGGKLTGKKNIVLSIALLTTFSTTGFIQLFLIYLFFIIRSKVNPVFKIIALIFFIFVSVKFFQNADFMQEKIEVQIARYSDTNLEGTGTGGRITRIRKGFNLLSTSPVIGRGIISEARDFDEYSEFFYTGAGFIRLFTSYGLIAGCFALLLYLKGLRLLAGYFKTRKTFAYFFLCSIILGGISQQFFTDNITLTFFMVGLLGIYKKQREYDSI